MAVDASNVVFCVMAFGPIGQTVFMSLEFIHDFSYRDYSLFGNQRVEVIPERGKSFGIIVSKEDNQWAAVEYINHIAAPLLNNNDSIPVTFLTFTPK